MLGPMHNCRQETARPATAPSSLTPPFPAPKPRPTLRPLSCRSACFTSNHLLHSLLLRCIFLSFTIFPSLRHPSGTRKRHDLFLLFAVAFVGVFNPVDRLALRQPTHLHPLLLPRALANVSSASCQPRDHRNILQTFRAHASPLCFLQHDISLSFYFACQRDIYHPSLVTRRSASHTVVILLSFIGYLIPLTTDSLLYESRSRLHSSLYASP